MDEIDRLLARVKQDCFGMLSLAVYRRIYETAEALGGGTFVEIGTSQGAATIAMALGAKAAGRPFRIYSADEFVTGSRPVGGSPAEKLEIVRRGYQGFGVADSIENVIGPSAALPSAADMPELALLLIDADGRIDRDFALLHARLAPDAPVIIDDVDDRIYVSVRKGGTVLDQKHRLTHRIVERYIAAGLLVADEASGQTGWYPKGPVSLSPAEIELLALPAYRELVMTPLGGAGTNLRWLAWRYVSARAPGLARAWRGLRGSKPG